MWEELHVLMGHSKTGFGKALVVLAEAWDRLEILGHYHNGQDKQVMANTTITNMYARCMFFPTDSWLTAFMKNQYMNELCLIAVAKGLSYISHV